MKDPDKLWLDIIHRFAAQSKCRTRQVGAIIVDSQGHFFGQGFNGAPRGSSTVDCPRCNSDCHQSGKNLEQAICVHAEINAIANAARSGRSTNGATIYCSTYPCSECAKAIVTAGITQVVYELPYDSPLTSIIFQNASIHVRKFNCDRL